MTYCIDCLCDTEAALLLLGATLLMVFFRFTIAPRDLRASKRMGPISFLAGCRKRRLPYEVVCLPCGLSWFSSECVLFRGHFVCERLCFPCLYLGRSAVAVGHGARD